MRFTFAQPLRPLLLLIVLVLSAGSHLFAQAPTWQDASGPGIGRGESTAVDAVGNTYVTGGFSGTATFGAITLTSAVGAFDLFVAKRTPAGIWQWATRAGGNGHVGGRSVAVDGSGSVVVTGIFYSPTITFGTTTLTNASSGAYDLFVAKLTPTGAWQWATGVGGSSSDSGYGVALDSSGSVVVTGSFDSPTITFGAITLANPNPGSEAIFLARLSGTTGLPDTADQPVFTLTPNPARTTVQLTGAPGPTATLLDGLGRLVSTAPVTPAGTATLDVRALPAGLYLLRAGAATRRLVVE